MALKEFFLAGPKVKMALWTVNVADQLEVKLILYFKLVQLCLFVQ